MQRGTATKVLLGEICRRIYMQTPNILLKCFILFSLPLPSLALSPCTHYLNALWYCDCDCVWLCLWVFWCVRVCVVYKSLCVRALTSERWLTNIGSLCVMFVKRAFVFEGVSKTTHSVRYSDTTDAIFSLVYYSIYTYNIRFHINIYTGVWSQCFDLFFGMCCSCVCLCGRVCVCLALPFLFSLFLFHSMLFIACVSAQSTRKREKEERAAPYVSACLCSSIHDFPHEI